MAFDYDLFVIGGGSGGVRAARTAAATGASVALAEESRMGGTCVIRGCVPKKLMVYASGYGEVLDEARAYGWEIGEGRFDWVPFREKLHAELDRLEGVYRRLLDGSGVEMFDARAKVVDPHTVELADGSRKTAKHILVATGGRPVRPDMKNAHLGMVSDDIFDLETLPKSILIVGGGYIACEFANILHGLGVKVTQFYRGAQILRGFDDEARGLIADSMRERGIDLHLGTNVVEMCPEAEAGDPARQHGTNSDAAGAGASLPEAERGTKGPVWVKATNGDEAVYDAVFFATGRKPNTEGLGLEEAGVKLARGGAIEVDKYSQTACPSIYAIGDVTDRVNLTPVAIREGMQFVETVFKGNPTPVDHALIPSAVFTQPELGTIGLTEEAAREIEPVEVYCSSFKPMRSSFAGSNDRVLMKLIVSIETRRVLGCHIVAPEAGELIQLAGIAVKMGATKEDFDRTVAVHPTMAEEIVTMREPVRRS
ncbi:FAD-dependent oxidoreductase [Limimaricola cinnabarinus]|uniref:NADPH-glutathione reductase n=1 Tax=Limimaricola cinnabarinus TaxID=1125964 RepID=A0A2G1MJD2_9RHOB|nr:FAD-dependent oxidoreductase [Limimaricola cinnabarinus]PHP28865.1 NADPH-glutathione reductase [Limimaricola cinnabarinus]